MRWMLIIPAALLGLFWSAPALAWGDSGHRTVCEIAYQRLTTPARTEVDRLLRVNPAIHAVQPLATHFPWACTYPDHSGPGGQGRRRDEHFVNYARSLAAVTRLTRCGVSTECILTAIDADFAILRDRTRSDPARGWALVYLGHWVGDIHQPLHSSYRDDEGGNQVNSSRNGCTYGLHSTWDTCILTLAHYPGTNQENPPSVDDVERLATAWSGQITAAQRTRWLRARPWQWSAESYRTTRSPRTQYCIMGQGGCRYSAANLIWAPRVPRRGVRIDDTYRTWAMPIIEERIKQAGVRLADTLNRALDPAYRP